MFLDIRLVFQENSHPEIRKTYFLAPKWGVDLYTGSTYTRVNTVLIISHHTDANLYLILSFELITARWISNTGTNLYN